MRPIPPARARVLTSIFERRYQLGELTEHEVRRHLDTINEGLDLYLKFYQEEKKL